MAAPAAARRASARAPELQAPQAALLLAGLESGYNLLKESFKNMKSHLETRDPERRRRRAPPAAESASSHCAFAAAAAAALARQASSAHCVRRCSSATPFVGGQVPVVDLSNNDTIRTTTYDSNMLDFGRVVGGPPQHPDIGGGRRRLLVVVRRLRAPLIPARHAATCAAVAALILLPTPAYTTCASSKICKN